MAEEAGLARPSWPRPFGHAVGVLKSSIMLLLSNPAIESLNSNHRQQKLKNPHKAGSLIWRIRRGIQKPSHFKYLIF